ncbi:hypothetical protein D3C71_1391820 [compost metagenome]
MCAIGGERLAESVEDFQRRAARVVRRFNHQRRDGTDQHRFRHTPLRLTVFCDVARNLPATRRVPDMHHVFQIQMLNDSGDVGGVVIHIVPVADLT